jgi:6-phosphogluconate dehydrogenase
MEERDLAFLLLLFSLQSFIPFTQTQISEAVFARMISAAKDERVEAAKLLTGPSVTPFQGNRQVRRR